VTARSAPGPGHDRVLALRKYIESQHAPEDPPHTAISLFAGAGLSDFGYRLAGFRFRAQIEADAQRAAVGKLNFPGSEWLVETLPSARDAVVGRCQKLLDGARPDLLTLTPPCQGMSSSNPSRGKRQAGAMGAHSEKNRLMLEAVPFARALRPRVIVAENVRPVLTLTLEEHGRTATVIEHLREGLPDYQVFHGVIDVADYGIPQTRRRAIVVAVAEDEPFLHGLVEKGLLPWPAPTHAETPIDGKAAWVSVKEWLDGMQYPSLDAQTKEQARGEHPLHRVPHYPDDRYLQIASIPANDGGSAYENDACLACGRNGIQQGIVTCSQCGELMRNRPYRIDEDGPRLIRGFHSSYRRMLSDRPAPTITTNTSHLGSDFKIHPWENRVMSTLECADLQSVPRAFDWSGALDARRHYLIRNVIGEAFPTYFAYLHGRILASMLGGSDVPEDSLASIAGQAAPRRRAVAPRLSEAA
jgi:DNA (cytosine-5)-methyltransferase 1